MKRCARGEAVCSRRCGVTGCTRHTRKDGEVAESGGYLRLPEPSLTVNGSSRWTRK